jgi:hypothetical protein
MWAGGSERNEGQEGIQVRRKEGQRVWNFFLQRHREGEEKTQNSFGMRIRTGDTFSVTMLGFSVKGEVSQDFSLFSWPFNYCSHLC